MALNLSVKHYWFISIVLMLLWLFVSIEATEKIEPVILVQLIVFALLIGISMKKPIAFKIGLPFFAIYSLYYFFLLFSDFTNGLKENGGLTILLKFSSLLAITFSLFKSRKIVLSQELLEEQAEEVSREFEEQPAINATKDNGFFSNLFGKRRLRGKIMETRNVKTAHEFEEMPEEQIAEENEGGLQVEQIVKENAEGTEGEMLEEEVESADGGDGGDGDGGDSGDAGDSGSDDDSDEGSDSAEDEEVDGEEVEEFKPEVTHHCPKCGHHVDPIDKFCSNCGKSFDKAVERRAK